MRGAGVRGLEIHSSLTMPTPIWCIIHPPKLALPIDVTVIDASPTISAAPPARTAASRHVPDRRATARPRTAVSGSLGRPAQTDPLLGGKLGSGLLDDLVAKVATQLLCGTEIDTPPAKQVDIAVGAHRAFADRAEQRQPADAMALAELHQGLAVGEQGWYGVIALFSRYGSVRRPFYCGPALAQAFIPSRSHDAFADRPRFALNYRRFLRPRSAATGCSGLSMLLFLAVFSTCERTMATTGPTRPRYRPRRARPPQRRPLARPAHRRGQGPLLAQRADPRPHRPGPPAPARRGRARLPGLAARLFAELAPTGEVDGFLVANLAAAMWRTGRAHRHESMACDGPGGPDERRLGLALRYHGSASRELFRSLRALQELRRRPLAAEPAVGRRPARARWPPAPSPRSPSSPGAAPARRPPPPGCLLLRPVAGRPPRLWRWCQDKAFPGAEPVPVDAAGVA